jgi:hypothetical protein
MPQRVGLVIINGGGEQLGGFHRSKLNQFFTHNNQLQLRLIALPVAMPLPIRMMKLHPNTTGDAPTHRFGWNQQWGRAIGWVPPKQIKSIFLHFLHTAINCGYG